MLSTRLYLLRGGFDAKNRTTHALRVLLCDLSSEVCMGQKPFHYDKSLACGVLLGPFPFHKISKP
jgi:hypothetical protein